MTNRWDVTKAVRASDLPAPGRHIMHTLADVAVVKTCEIPPQHTPSLNVLADETGLDKSTISRHLRKLDEAGWLERTRPTPEEQRRGGRTTYRLLIGSRTYLDDSPSEVVADDDTEVDAEDDQDDVQVGAESNGGSRTEGQGVGAQDNKVGAQNDRGRRRGRHKSRQSDLVRSVRSSSSSDAAHRPDVEKLCEHLADRIHGNGANRPNITAKWRDSARLMLDRDGRTVDKIMTAIDWCQDDEFWRSNILSMHKLRERYEQLRLAAQRTSPKQAATQPPNLNAAMERAMAREAQRS